MSRTSPSAASLSNLRIAILAAALLFLVAACGAGSSDTIESAAALDDAAVFASVPAVPTTAPILLPPEDTSLPAFAPLPTTVPVVIAAIEPESTAVPVVIASIDSWSPCVVSAAQSVGASQLLDPIANAPSTDLSSVQLNALAAAAAPCDLVSGALGSTDLAAHLPSATSCMNEWLASSGGGAVFTGLASISFGQPTPSWAQPHLTSSVQSCFGGASFAAQVMADVAADPTLTAAFDSQCLATSFEASGVLANVAQWLATDPVNASFSISMSDSWVMSCANVGRVVAAAAAAEGVALSANTVACLDAELTSSGLASQLLAGTADSDAVGIATISCLTNDEASALLS